MRWRLKTPASWLFTEPFVKTQIKESIKSLHHWALWGGSPVNSPHKGPVTRKMFPFDDVIMKLNPGHAPARRGIVTHPVVISYCHLTHWGRVTHICVGKLTIIGSDNGLSPGRRQAIIWTNAGILLIGPFGTNFSEILIATETFSFKKMHLKMSSAKWRLFGLGLNELTESPKTTVILGSSWVQQYIIRLPQTSVTIQSKWNNQC